MDAATLDGVPEVAGPSTVADWSQSEVPARAGAPALVGALPDAAQALREAAGAGRVLHVLLRRPLLWRDGSSVPALSLALVLTRAPRPSETNVSPLVDYAHLTFDLRLSVPPDVRDRLDFGASSHRPIFVRDANVDLVWTGGPKDEVLSHASASGVLLRVALAARLSREQALDVLSVLSGRPSRMRVRGRAAFRGIDPIGWTRDTRVLDFDVPLELILRGAIESPALERHISLIAPGASNGPAPGPGPAPARVRAPASGTRASASGAERVAAIDGEVKSIALAMQPRLGASTPAALITSDVVRPAALQTIAGRPQHWLVDNAVLEVAAGSQTRSLPVVDDPDAPLFRDRQKDGLYWYAPAVDAMWPDPAGDPGSSPFLFTFARTGATASGAPSLSAAVRFRLRRRVSEATQRALASIQGGVAREVQPLAVSASLVIPYVSDADGQLRTTIVRGTAAAAEGGWILSFDLLNEWVRLCYGRFSCGGMSGCNVAWKTTRLFAGLRASRVE